MSVMDKIINAMKFNDEDDYDDEEEYEDEEDYYGDETPAAAPEPVRTAPRAAQTSAVAADNADDEESASPRPRRRFGSSPAPVDRSESSSVSRQVKKQYSEAGMEVCIIKPTSVNDAREVTDTLLANSTVVLNLEGLDVEIAQRVIDFTCGVCYALDGSLQKISNYIFIITPAEVDISGDFQSILSGAFDLPSMTSPY